MATTEEIVAAFEECLCKNNPNFCSTCYQKGPGFGLVCRINVCLHALPLLKKQLPVKPEVKHATNWCGVCGNHLKTIGPKYRDKYCGHCGRAVKWEEEVTI